MQGHSSDSQPGDSLPTACGHLPPASRLGFLLFVIYLVFYVGFVLISALASQWLEIILPGGLNLAVVYGLALIVLAFVLSLIYGLCQRNSA